MYPAYQPGTPVQQMPGMLMQPSMQQMPGMPMQQMPGMGMPMQQPMPQMGMPMDQQGIPMMVPQPTGTPVQQGVYTPPAEV
jgi:hypothetical protein